MKSQIGTDPYLMLSDSSIIKESDGLMTDLENDVLTLFAPLEDESYEIKNSLQGFLLSSDGSKAFWLTTETLSIDENQTVSETSKSYPSINSPEAEPYRKAIDELTKNNQTKKGSFWLMLLFAFLGGIILNLMPCVFPVLGIKILGFVQQSGNDKRKIRLHGWSFASGIFISLWLLVSILFLVRNSGESAGWGFQFQHPWFVLILIAVMFSFSLNLFGLFEIGTSLTGAGSKLQSKEGLPGSFFSGILAVLVATPCTGPFMGPALGFALSGPELQGYALFTSLAAGLALPYVVLSYMPKLVEMLPRPGKWMETFKQFMAFPLLATVIWLLNILGKAIGLSSVIWTLLALVILALGLWIFGKYSNPLSNRTMTKWLARMALLLCCGICFKIGHTVTQTESIATEGSSSKTVHGITYEPFDPIIALGHVRNGKNVFIDYTAVW
jgi:thiol:disulfide interchange protein DsbD